MISSPFFYGVQVFVVVFEFGNIDSLILAESLIISLKTKDLNNPEIILVGNKTDLIRNQEEDVSKDSTTDSQELSNDERNAQEIADRLEVQLIKTSVYDGGTNVEAVF